MFRFTVLAVPLVFQIPVNGVSFPRTEQHEKVFRFTVCPKLGQCLFLCGSIAYWDFLQAILMLAWLGCLLDG